MEIKEGYAYHIKDSYFDRMQDDKLMKNKEAGNYRPTLYCMKDKKMDVLWMIPISSQYDKFTKIRNKILAKGIKVTFTNIDKLLEKMFSD